MTQLIAKFDFRVRVEGNTWHRLTPNQTFGFQRNKFRVCSKVTIAILPMQNARVCFVSIMLKFTFDLNSKLKFADS